MTRQLLDKIDSLILAKKRSTGFSKLPHIIVVGNVEREALGAIVSYRGYTFVHSPRHDTLIKIVMRLPCIDV